MEQCCKRLLGKMTKTALLSGFFHFGFWGGIGQASEIYIEKSIWNDDQAAYELDGYDSILLNKDLDWYLNGCNVLYIDSNSYAPGPIPMVSRLRLSDLTLHVELGERNRNEAILNIIFGKSGPAHMAFFIKWDITASSDLEPGRYLLFTNTKSLVVPRFQALWDDNPCIEAEYDDSCTWISIYYNHPGSQVPEPGAAGLSLLGLAAALWRRRRE